MFQVPKWAEGKIDFNGPNGCWVWMRAKIKYGYGCNGGGLVHRQFLSIKVGRPLLRSECALHACDNPSCVNPDHLWIGTIAENNRDRVIKGRSNRPRGERNGRAVLTESQALEIRRRRGDGERCRDLAKEFGVSNQLISNIGLRIAWSHLP